MTSLPSKWYEILIAVSDIISWSKNPDIFNAKSFIIGKIKKQKQEQESINKK